MVPEEDFAICVAALACEGYEPEYHNQGLTEKQMRTQAFHGELIEEVGKYLVL
jgi:hypothetical protein